MTAVGAAKAAAGQTRNDGSRKAGALADFTGAIGVDFVSLKATENTSEGADSK